MYTNNISHQKYDKNHSFFSLDGNRNKVSRESYKYTKHYVAKKAPFILQLIKESNKVKMLHLVHKNIDIS